MKKIYQHPDVLTYAVTDVITMSPVTPTMVDSHDDIYTNDGMTGAGF